MTAQRNFNIEMIKIQPSAQILGLVAWQKGFKRHERKYF